MFLTILLSLYELRNIPPEPAACIRERQDFIADRLDESYRVYHVPRGVMLVVSFAETHVGCARNEGGNWGAPIDANHRHTAGTPLQAARILARSYDVCGNWRMAVARFRSGVCRPQNPVHINYTNNVERLVRRVYRETAQPLPYGF